MRRARPSLAAAAGFVALVAAPGAARADCTTTGFGGVQAAAAENCTFYGEYTTTVDGKIAGHATGLGVLNAMPGEGGPSYSTTGANAFAIQADSGGSVVFTPPAEGDGTVSTTGDGSIGLYATGKNGTVASSIDAPSVDVTTEGVGATGVLAESGASVTMNGGSIMTSGTGAYAAVAHSGGTVSLTDVTIGTTANGSGGLGINGAGSEIDATGVSITTTGGYDATSQQHSYGVYNGPYQSFTSGGVAKLTDTTISTSGVSMYGVITSTGGTTTILGGSVMTSGRAPTPWCRPTAA